MTILAQHLGAGDLLICQGLTRQLAKQHDILNIPVWKHNLALARHLYEDCDNIKFMCVDSQAQMLDVVAKNGAIKLGMYAGEPWDPLHWDREFYRQAGVDFSERWSGFMIPNLPEIAGIGSFAFLHQDVARGYVACHYEAPENCVTVTPSGYDSILDYIPYIRAAKEVHCIDSAFLCLVDSLPQRNGQKLYFHKYARPQGIAPTLRREWKVLA